MQSLFLCCFAGWFKSEGVWAVFGAQIVNVISSGVVVHNHFWTNFLLSLVFLLWLYFQCLTKPYLRPCARLKK